MRVDGLSLHDIEVLSNVDAEWREAKEVRRALRITVPKASGVLNSLRHRGLVESRRHWRECPTCGSRLERVQWRVTDAGTAELARLRS